MNITDHIERGSRDYPERPAIIFEGQTLTYRECDEMSSRAATVLSSAGIMTGDRVALFLPNIPAFVTLYLGVLKLGAIAVSINATLKNDEVSYVLSDCGAKAVVTTRDLRERIDANVKACIHVIGGEFDKAVQTADRLPTARCMEAAAPAAIVYTSGTIGRPKGATLSHANVVRNMEAKQRYLGIRAEDRGLLFLPLYHCFGQNAILNAFLQTGATVILHQRFDLHAVMQSITRDGVTMFFGVPTTYSLLLDQVSPSAMAKVRYYFSAAAPLSVEVETRWKTKFGAPIYQGYGLTETSPFASYNHLQAHRIGSIGTPIDGVSMKIVDPDTGASLGPGGKGEIAVRGHNVMLGYWNRPEETAKSIRDGWFHTGDIGSVDEEGYFFIYDRLTDMIVSGGVNVYPVEVENALAAHPAIVESAVYGVPEKLLGEQVCADIILKAGASLTETEVRAFCQQRLAAVKVPVKIRFIAEIPKSPTGKVLKRVLRDRASAEESACNKVAKYVDGQEVSAWIRMWLHANLDLHGAVNFSVRAPFADLGIDSILAVRMANELGDWLGCKVEVSAIWSFPTVEAMAEHIASRSRENIRQFSRDVAMLSDEAAETLLLTELEAMNR